MLVAPRANERTAGSTVQNTLQFTKPFATKTSAPLLLALALGGHAPEVRDEAEIRAFLDGLETQEFLVSIGLGLEEYNQWRGNSPHFIAEFTRCSNDIHSRCGFSRRGCHFRAATCPTRW